MKITKRTLWITGAAILAAAIVGGTIQAVQTSIGDDVDSDQLKSLVVEGWEKDIWTAEAVPPKPESNVEVKAIGDGNKRCVPKNLAFSKANQKCMGVRFSFVYPGDNKVVLTPTRTNKIPTGHLKENNEPEEREFPGIRLPGKVKAVSVWVLGRGNEYNLEIWIEDWRRDTHIYQFGSIDFVGWRPLTIKIPENVPQDVESYPQTKSLVIKKMILRSTPTTSQEKVVVFFDSLKVLTDVYDVFFDGADVDFDDQDRAEKDALRKAESDARKYSEAGGGGGGGR